MKKEILRTAELTPSAQRELSERLKSFVETGNYIDQLKRELKESEERVKELEAKIASYESAIDGLKKVVDSLYNLRS